jgi:hypothetical protein
MALDDKNAPAETRTFTSVRATKDEVAAGKIRSKYWEAVQGLRTELRDYWLNHAFLHGYQWLYWSEDAGRLDERPADPERIQATVNRMWPNTRTIISTLMQRTLSFEVPPKAADDSHMRGARLGETIIRSVHHDHNWENLREHVLYAAWKGGTAAIAVGWDPDLETTLDDDTQGNPIQKGDTYEEHLNITQFVVEPGARDPEKARWWIKSVALPPKDVQLTFGLDDEPPADATAGLAPFHRKLMSYDRGGDAEVVDLTLVMTYYERPSEENEDGRVVTVVDNNIIHDDVWPFPFKDRLNLVVIRETLRENRWTGDTVMTAARPMQTLLNVSASSVAEHMKLAGNARLLIPYSSLEMMENLTDLPGEMVPYNDALPVKPQYLSPPSMPEWWMRMPREWADHIDDIMGVHDISRGSAPANIESGFGLTILAEKDNTPTTRLTKETAGAFGRLATMVLKIYEHEIGTSKVKRRSLVHIPGNAPIDVMWDGSDFKGQTTVIVPEDAIMPRSRAAQMEMAKDMMDAGLIEGMVDFLTVAEVPGYKDILTVTSPHIDQARRENSQFGLGRQSVPEEWHDHAAHIDEHNKYRTTVDYLMLSTEDKEMIDDHIVAHEALAAKEVGHARKRSQLDPALGMAPTAAQGPVLEPLALPAGGSPSGPPNGGAGLPAAAQGALDGLGQTGPTPDQAASEIMQLMSTMGGA